MKAHRLASYFPIMEGEKFDKFVEDIKENGQIEPILLFDGEILDGVNRYKACQQLGIEPKYTEYQGKDPLHYVISVNVHRRHMSASQLAMVATEMLPEFEKITKIGRPTNEEKVIRDLGPNLNTEERRSSEQVAKEFGISSKSVRRAKRVKEQAPEKVRAGIQGKENIKAIDTELRIKAETERKAKAIAEGRTEKPVIQLRIEEQEYLLALDSVISRLPKTPPSDWTEKFFNEAKAKANIIINRLEVFNG